MVNPNSIPRQLRALDQWLCWKQEERDGKTTKVPYNAHTGGRGRSNDPSTWSAFDLALGALQNGAGHNGIGFAFRDGDGLCGIDLDHCREGNDREMAEAILKRFSGTYCELSPSGQGVRIFALGALRRCGKGTKHKWVEAYDHTSPRYLTVTGHHLKGSATESTNQQEALDWLYDTYFKPKEQPERATTLCANIS